MARWHVDLEVDAPDLATATIKALTLASYDGVRLRCPVQSVPSRECAVEEARIMQRNARLNFAEPDDEC